MIQAKHERAVFDHQSFGRIQRRPYAYAGHALLDRRKRLFPNRLDIGHCS